MKFEKFEKITRYLISEYRKSDDTAKLGIDLIEYCEGYHIIIDTLLSEIITDQGLDWFNWFLYEKDYISDGVGREDMKAYDNDVEILRTLEELYQYLVENKYFKCNLN